MDKESILRLRQSSRKLIRELGMLQLNQAKSGRTPQHFHALIEIEKTPDITVSKLGQLLLLSTSATSRIVDSLIKQGLVVSGEGIDKREKKLAISDLGQFQIEKIDEFSNAKIIGAFEFLTPEEQEQIINSIQKYSQALEKSRVLREQVKIRTLSTSRTLRKQIISMIENIQINEFSIPISSEVNIGILRAEEEYYYNNTYNFWYAIDDKGAIIGSIGLKKIDSTTAEIKKLFVVKDYRGKGVAQKLLNMLVKSAFKHEFDGLYLGTVNKLGAAQRFYQKYGFSRITEKQLPPKFEKCHVDTDFFKGRVKDVVQMLKPMLE